jgi:hypothetical protein
MTIGTAIDGPEPVDIETDVPASDVGGESGSERFPNARPVP